jgi:succinate dehydrogenase/fumarate reductase flavoprotein subunit
MDVADLHFQAALHRKETRLMHVRLDYPKSDPALDGKLLYQRLEKGSPVIEMRSMNPMQFSDDHKETR